MPHAAATCSSYLFLVVLSSLLSPLSSLPSIPSSRAPPSLDLNCQQMKIQCDVCNREEATVFCTADEAALCDACDHRVHHANKLASKHQRFSLLHPSPKQVPLCDVCQEKRAFLFCQQDRAILCRDCDLPIHTANEHTQKHNRFLLTGIKLSATSALYSSTTSDADSVSDPKSQPSLKKPESVPPEISHPPSITKTSSPTTAINSINKGGGASLTSEGGSTSSISEYLIEMLPGWHVEDFLDSTSAPSGFCKSAGDDVKPYFLDADLDNNLSSFSSESLGIWVPQAPTPLLPCQYSSFMGGQIGFKESKEATATKANSKKWRDDAFTVPQISPPSAGSKRSRSFW